MHNHHHILLSVVTRARGTRVWCLPVVSRVRCLRSVCLAQGSQIDFCFLWEKKSDGLKWCPHKVISCVHGGQPIVLLRAPFSRRQVNAWICARRATDRDLQRVSARVSE